MGTETVLQVTNVTKAYGKQVAVDNLSFEVERGEIFAFLGPNGAGKTTTMRMILDILKPDQGSITVLGGSINDKRLDRIGYMPEERGLYKNVPILDLMVYLGTLKGMSATDAKQRAVQLLDQVELGEHQKSKVTELSKGMQQKLQFIVTILHRPELIIVDEPFSGLDPVNTQVLKDMVFDLSAGGMTVVMSTHMMHQVEEMGDRLLMIDHGRRVLYGPVDEVRARFAQNAVMVQGTGDWAAVPGVRSVHMTENGREAILQLQEGVTPDNLMRELAISPDHHVQSFSLALPSLNDIFIEVAGGNNHAA
ncbi:MAG: ATP-binding cassette domain-containing protein [Anaerolineae bacterium]|nr:ATP-binding cassette domain-containing protein [Anaerolineae bacterium]